MNILSSIYFKLMYMMILYYRIKALYQDYLTTHGEHKTMEREQIKNDNKVTRAICNGSGI